MVERDELTLAVTIGLGIASIYHSELPSLYDLREDGDEGQLRQAEAQVAGLSLALGAAIGALAKSWLPFYAAAGVSGAILAQYELAARREP